MRWARLLSLLAAATLAAGEDFTARCPAECACKWQSGNKAAHCADGNLTSVPPLSAEIQILDLSENPLYELRQRAFRDVGLSNLKKLFVRSCRLQAVHRDALSGLSIMIELDLSHNHIALLPPDTFRDTDKLRWLVLSHNRLERLDDGLFRGLPFLQKIELSDNRLVRVAPRAFADVPKLSVLKLGGNRLEHLKLGTLGALAALSSLELDGNPWRCDCELRPLRAWALTRKLYTSPTSCAEPPHLAGRTWTDLDAANFACRPSVLQPSPGATVRVAPAHDLTLACLVSGDPLPEASWVLDSRAVGARSDPRYRIDEVATTERTKWINLTIACVSASDAGLYKCVARNMAGVEERGLAVRTAGRGEGAAPASGLLPLLVGAGVAGAALLALAAASCYCCVRRRRTEKLNKTGADALLEGSVIPEIEKSMMSAVNPVTKPPRRCDARVGATEMSDMDSTLLDNDSIFGAHESGALLGSPARAPPLARPPDLLAFPPRAPTSPAASAPPGFRTLPHARAASPGRTAAGSRRGYVTIPRRPRAPSWSAPTAAAAAAPEPLYDNLGLRTTADGSSVLSLDIESAGSPMRGRPLPAAPLEPASRSSWAAPSPAPAPRKTPPRPPPKPKKKSPESSEPLYEDEGEDGTEV